MKAGPSTGTEALLRELAAHPIAVEEQARSSARRELLLPKLRAVAESAYVRQQNAVRYRARAAVASALTLAAAVALYVGVPALNERERQARSSTVLALAGSVGILHDAHESEAPSLQPVQVSSSDEVVTAEGGRARASLPSGAEVEIGPQSRVRLRNALPSPRPLEAGEAVDLEKGRVLVRVPKLGAAGSFTVRTLEATVVVHGTVFTVERAVGHDGGTLTTVDVEQGIVAVRQGVEEVWLRDGDHWSSDSSRKADGETEVAPGGPLHRVDDGGPAPAPGAADRQRKGSTLAAENRLLEGAMTARQDGNARRALELADRLLDRYPSSALREQARVERLRAVVILRGRTAGAREARRYLADYPHGFAAQEASRHADPAQ